MKEYPQHPSNHRFLVPLSLIFLAINLSAGEFRLELTEKQWELRPGLSTTFYAYSGSVPGVPILVSPGERVKIEVINRLKETTNVHWHGLVLPNDQDGPALSIKAGQTFKYEFVAGDSGTYWYHPHSFPVLEQLDRGLYGSFIIRSPEDALYSGDHTYILDDWLLDAQGTRLRGNGLGNSERLGNVETVNGKTGPAIEVLKLRSGELHKLRFINASAAAVHTIHIGGHRFRVTHTDGHALEKPYETDEITLTPAERLDVELYASGKAGQQFEMASPRRELGIAIPIVYSEGSIAPVASPFLAPKKHGFVGLETKQPDFTLNLSTAMGGMMGGGMRGGSMRWTINGRSYPDTKPLEVRTNRIIKIRINDKDMMGAMMGKAWSHSLHIHGTVFQVLSVNGKVPDGELWKDTVPIPRGGYVDIAFIMTREGDWMVHCHVIDHEDGGMMTMVRAKD
ncbi:multicopper oxidase family protein [Treponema sp.]